MQEECDLSCADEAGAGLGRGSNCLRILLDVPQAAPPGGCPAPPSLKLQHRIERMQNAAGMRPGRGSRARAGRGREEPRAAEFSSHAAAATSTLRNPLSTLKIHIAAKIEKHLFETLKGMTCGNLFSH